MTRRAPKKKGAAPGKPHPKTPPAPPTPPPRKARLAAIVLALLGLNLLVFGQVRRQDFVNYDDFLYVYENRTVMAGLSAENLVWAFAEPHIGHYHPLTWISYMADVSLFGVNAAAMKLVSLAFHTANTLLLFWLFLRMTKACWRSALLAALFAIHPLHVEPVVWVSSRKDMLSAFFLMLMLLSYVRYVERRSLGRYGLVALCFVLGLLSKPILVTAPFALLLLDYWPLGRVESPWARGNVWRLVREKALLFLLSGVSCLLTYHAGRSYNVVGNADLFPLPVRLGNALVSYATYLRQCVWPAGLSPHYPHPGATLPPWQILLAVAVLAGISALVFLWRRRCPFLPVGWLWYLGTLAPVIGIIQIGGHASADRYMYLPFIGLALMLVWGVADATARWRYQHLVLAPAAVVAVAVLAVCAWFQAGHWLDSETLCRHALAVNARNIRMHLNLGVVLKEQGKLDEALAEYEQALRLNPRFADIHSNLAGALLDAGDIEKAEAHCRKAIELDPKHAYAYSNLGNILTHQGRLDEAVAACQRALALKPDYTDAHKNLSAALRQLGKLDQALIECREAIRLDPGDAGAYTNLGNVLFNQGKPEEAMAQYTRALDIEPGNADTYSNIGNVLFRLGKLDEAIGQYTKALELAPDMADAHSNLGGAFFTQGKLDEAIAHYTEALRINPNHADAHTNLAAALAQQGKLDEAIAHYGKAIEINPRHPNAHTGLANILLHTGKPDQAAEHYRRALELNPNNPTARQNLQRIEEEQKSL